MQALKPLALLFLGVSFAKGDFWWMNNGNAFGGNTDSQGTSGSSGGYGGGGGKTVTGYPQNSGGYPQNKDRYPQNGGEYPQKTGGYPQSTQGYPQSTGGYPQNVGGYPQNTGDVSTGNGNLNGATNLSGPNQQQTQDFSGVECPAGLACVAESGCQVPRVQGLQERVANFIQCGQNKICCGNSPDPSDPFVGSGSAPSSSSVSQTQTGIIELPQTQCSEGWKCVSDLFCDASATMVPFRVELTQEERRKRGNLIPCMNQVTQQFDVCCRKPPVLAPIEKNEIDKLQRQEVKPTTCPVINVLPPIEECRGRPSNCWSVGVPDTDCVGHALCCFDGCANVCQGQGPIKSNPGPQSNARGQQRQNTVNNANSELNANKPEAFQDLSQQPINQDFGGAASSLQSETIKQNTPSGYSGQPLPTPQKPLVLSIQKQQPIKVAPTQAPVTTEPQNQPITEQVQNTEDFSAENTNTPFATDNKNSSEVSPGYSTMTQPETSPANYPPTNHHRIVFPDDEEETSFPAFPQTSVPSFSAQPSPSTSRSAPLKVTPPVPSTVAQPSPAQTAASQPFVTCPSAMKCVEKRSCNFNGVMVDQPVLLNPVQEAQRVPLIPCFNTARSNAVDVCCRDPNYRDPWPNSQHSQQKQFGHHGQEEEGSGTFQDLPSAPVKNTLPKKRRTNAYGK